MSAPLTDLHTHILAGLDDGAEDLAESLAMAAAAAADGIRRLAATPHSLRCPPGTDAPALEARAADLERHLQAAGLPLTVVAGAETGLIPALPRQIDAGAVVTLNRSRYLLLELPYVGLPARLDDLIVQVSSRGLVPILAHPERNAELARRPQLLHTLVGLGLVVQITSGSLEGIFGRAVERAARRLLEAGLVHVIASDAHDPYARPPRLSQARALATRIVGPERAQALVAANPAAILDDRPLEVEPPPPLPRRLWFWPVRSKGDGEPDRV